MTPEEFEKRAVSYDAKARGAILARCRTAGSDIYVQKVCSCAKDILTAPKRKRLLPVANLCPTADRHVAREAGSYGSLALVLAATATTTPTPATRSPSYRRGPMTNPKAPRSSTATVNA